MQTISKRPIVNDDLVRRNPRLAARIQTARFRRRVAERTAATQRHSSDDQPVTDLVHAWWQASHSGVDEQS